MNFLICCLAIVVSSRPQDPLEKNDLELKLDQYQNATGISDDKRNEIWDKTMENCKFYYFYQSMNFFSASIGLEKLSRIGNGSIWHQRRSLWFSITSTHGYWIFQPWNDVSIGNFHHYGSRILSIYYHNQSGFTAKYGDSP